MPIRLIVHGGAGPWKKENPDDVLAGMRRAAEIGWAVLQDGGSALDAVEQATVYLEDHPLFDAGYGSFLNAFGEVSMDALIVDGAARNFGAVAGLKHIKNPITLARLVMTETRHNYLIGDGAEQFASKQGIDLLPNIAFVTEREFAAFRERMEIPPDDLIGHGTVGAVAIDTHDNIATATTTGGAGATLRGRVGDVPVIGSGGYAENGVGGASATGRGENIMRHVLSRQVIDNIRAGQNALTAAQAGVNAVEAHLSPSEVGIIVVDGEGNLGAAHTTANMPVSWVDDAGTIHAAMKQPYF